MMSNMSKSFDTLAINLNIPSDFDGSIKLFSDLYSAKLLYFSKIKSFP